MELRIGNSSDYLIIKDIEPEGQVEVYPIDIHFLRGTIQLQMSEISSNIGASFTLSELRQFLPDLQRLYDTLKFSFVFKNIEDNIELTFQPTPNGQIEINGLLRNSDYTGSIKFKIETDQTYLPGLIENLKEMLRELQIG